MDFKGNIVNYCRLYTKSLIFVWKSSPLLCGVLVISVPVQALLPSITLYVTNILVNIVETREVDELVRYLIIWCCLFIGSNLMSPFNTFIQGQLTDKLTFYMNYKIMQKSEDIQDIGCFEDSEFYDRINLLSSEASWRPINLLVFGCSIVSNMILLISMAVLLSSFHIIIALILFVSMLIQGIITYRIQKQSFEILVSNTEDSRKLSYYSEAVLSADYIKEVRLYNLYSFFRDKYKNTYEHIRKGVQNNRIKQFVVAGGFLLVAGTISTVSFWFILNGILNDLFSLGSILIFSSSILYSVQAVTVLVQDGALLYDTLLYMDNLFGYLEIKTAETNLNGDVLADFHKLEVKNLSYQYKGTNRLALDDISFEVKKGEKIAIVGENGAGKSTLIKLLMRLYQADEGRIFMNDVPIEKIKITDYRRLFSAAFQDYAKFDMTLEDNVRISDLSKNEKECVELKRISGELGAEKQQMLGKLFSEGRELSGGQWQKVALARAFYAEAPIVILDEPTAALDARNERYFFDKLDEKVSKDQTVFFITHRLSSVKKADKILVLKDGKVVDFDIHSNLLMRCPYYTELYNLQAEMYFPTNELSEKKKTDCNS